jgi:hypothetical protein
MTVSKQKYADPDRHPGVDDSTGKWAEYPVTGSLATLWDARGQYSSPTTITGILPHTSLSIEP